MDAPPLATPYPSWFTSARSATIASTLARPAFREKVAILKQIAARGPLPVAVISRPLPVGVSGIVRLNQPSGPAKNYLIVSSSHFDDEVYHYVRLQAVVYATTHADDDSPVNLTVRDDGSVEYLSAKSGHGVEAYRAISRTIERRRLSSAILQRAANGVAREVPGFGVASVVAP